MPYNVGSSTSDAWGTAFSDVWTMTGDGAVTVTFTNHCATDGNLWENWQLLCGNESYTPAAHDDANRYFQMRSDRWDDAAGSAVGFILSDDYFTDFKTFQNGATVTLKIVRSGTTVTVNTSVTKSATTRTMTFVKTGLAGTVNFFLTQSLSYMTITAQDQTTEMAGSVTCNALMNFDNFTGDQDAGSGSSLTGGKGTMYLDGAFQYKNADNDYRLGMRSGQNNITISSSEYAGSKDIVTISFDLAYTQMANKDKSVYFYIQDASSANIAEFTVTTNNTSSGYIKSLSTNLDIVAADIVVPYSVDWAKKVHFDITINYLTRKITTKTSCSGATNTTSTHEVTLTNNNPVAKFVVGAGYNSDSNKYRCQLDNLLIQTEKGDYNTTANITLAFEDNDGADISALYTGTTAFTPDKSTTFTPSDYYPAVMYDDDYKYTYTSGGDAFTVTGDATVTLVYTKSARPTYTFNVTANYGAKNQKIVDEVIVKEAADYTYYYPRFIKDGTTLYEYASSTDANASGSYWTSTHTNVAANGTYTLTYNAIEGECVYYSEGEDVAGAVPYRYSGFRTAMSNGATGYLNAATLTNLGEGVYRVTASGVGRASDRYVRIYKSSVSDENKILEFLISNGGTERSAIFSLTGVSTDIIASAGYNTTTENGAGCDYVYIMKLPTTVSATIGATGWTTFASAYPLNLSTLTASTGTATAYYASSVNASTVTMTSTTATVPAGEGLALKGTAGATVTIPVAASGDAISGNKLVGCTAETVLGTDPNYYVLVNNGGTAEFQKLDEHGATIPAGKAYLNVGAGARSLSIVFGDDATGVQELKNSRIEGLKSCYDLQGRRVAQPTRGLYIMNGRKYVAK